VEESFILFWIRIHLDRAEYAFGRYSSSSISWHDVRGLPEKLAPAPPKGRKSIHPRMSSADRVAAMKMKKTFFGQCSIVLDDSNSEEEKGVTIRTERIIAKRVNITVERERLVKRQNAVTKERTLRDSRSHGNLLASTSCSLKDAPREIRGSLDSGFGSVRDLVQEVKLRRTHNREIYR